MGLRDDGLTVSDDASVDELRGTVRLLVDCIRYLDRGVNVIYAERLADLEDAVYGEPDQQVIDGFVAELERDAFPDDDAAPA